MHRVICTTIAFFVLVTISGGQPPVKPVDLPAITPEELRRSSLTSLVPESSDIKYIALAGERAYPAFEVILADPASDARLVNHIVVILVCQNKANRSRFLPFLRKLLVDRDFEVRLWTIVAVAQIGNKEDLPALATFLSSDHEWTVKHAASAVAKIGGESGLAVLDVWLLSARDRNDPKLRKHVVECRDELKQRLDKEKDKQKKAP